MKAQTTKRKLTARQVEFLNRRLGLSLENAPELEIDNIDYAIMFEYCCNVEMAAVDTTVVDSDVNVDLGYDEDTLTAISIVDLGGNGHHWICIEPNYEYIYEGSYLHKVHTLLYKFNKAEINTVELWAQVEIMRKDYTASKTLVK